MYMRFNPYHGGLLTEQLTLEDIKQFNLCLGLSVGGSGLDECEEKYYNPPSPEVK